MFLSKRSFSRNFQVLAISSLVAIGGCSKQTPPPKAETVVAEKPVTQVQEQIHPQMWSDIISGKPEGRISATAPMNVDFSFNVRGEKPLNQALKDIVTIMPNVPIQVYFTSDSQLQITPLEPLKQNTAYDVSLNPKALSGVNDNQPPFVFMVEPYQQDFSLQVEGISLNETASIIGNVSTNDAATKQQVEKLLSATQNNKPLAINWQQDGPLKWQFTVTDIQQGKTASSVELSWQGDAIGAFKSGVTQIEIPAQSSFEILSAITEQQGKQQIKVNFSQPLAKQSLNGLVTLNGKAPSSTRINANQMIIYPAANLSGEITLKIESGIKAANGKRLSKGYEKSLTFLTKLPGIAFADNTYILPSNGKLRIPIKAVNVNSVQISAYRMPEGNLGSFLRYGSLSRSYIDNGTSILEWRKTYSLPEPTQDKWKTFDLVLDRESYPLNADLLALSITINAGNTDLPCNQGKPKADDSMTAEQWPTDDPRSTPNWVNKYYHSQGYYNWQQSKDPCQSAYYQANRDGLTRLQRYYLQSDLGIVAKMAQDHSMRVAVTDINTSQPIKDAEIKLYGAQNQDIGDTHTDENGFANINPMQPPKYLMVTHRKQIGFLRLDRSDALSTNNFDVAGAGDGSSIKGFFFTERGVWRPGDNIFLNFVVEDKTGKFDPKHPLTVDFFDPKGTKVEQQTQTQPVGGIYAFTLKTDEKAPTGNWRAVIRYGGNYFSKVIPVETIVPNRLKVTLDFPQTPILMSPQGTPVDLMAAWLNGATAKNLKADISVSANARKTDFKGYSQYLFDDPVRKLHASTQEIFNGTLNAEGEAKATLPPLGRDAPGEIALTFTTRVFEQSGAFSTQYQTVNYLPYKQWVGLNVPAGSAYAGSIAQKDKIDLNLVTLTDQGKPAANSKIDLSIYRLEWSWWWDASDNNLQRYVSSRHSNRQVNETLTTNDEGKARWQLNGQDFNWGRYLVRACDKTSGHCTGKITYIGWSSNAASQGGAEFLTLSTDKPKYQSGETAHIQVPDVTESADETHRWLLTLESASQILSQQWVTPDQNDRIAIPVSTDMAPNVYAHLTLIQGVNKKTNDRPVRMYGIVPLLVENPDSKLLPQISTPDEVRPNQTLKIEVSEKNQRPMSYTLAVVDEGLLGITNFQTPNPYKAFFTKEKLGVLTWDLYKFVSSADQGIFYPAIQIGGSDKGEEINNKRKRRFTPVVNFQGPFELEAGKTAQHEIKIPNYMGAVRVMVVAAHDNLKAQSLNGQQAAYGNASESVKVTQPLTLLTTLPRVLGPDESLIAPITVFANDDKIKNVTVTSKTNDILETKTGKAKLHFTEKSDKVADLAFKVADRVGQAEIAVTATSGNEKASDTVNIDVRTANQPQTVTKSLWLESQQTGTLKLVPQGMPGTNQAHIGFSRLPNIDLTSQLNYLIGYPHGCVEQTVSKTFPQLYLNHFVALSEAQKSEVQNNIRAAIDKLQGFQSAAGSFSYWPGGNYYNRWASTYAGHFLVEARKTGFVVPNRMLSEWISNQRDLIQNAGSDAYYFATDAYTLYVLAVAGEPDFAAMNRLKTKMAEKSKFAPGIAKALLGAAYAKAGVTDIGKALVGEATANQVPFNSVANTYGSPLRDKAIMVIANQAIGDKKAAYSQAENMTRGMGVNTWYSTQTRAFTLLALAEILTANPAKDEAISFRVNQGKWQTTELSAAFATIKLDTRGPLTVEFKNDGQGPFFVSLSNRGIPPNGREVAYTDNVSLKVKFTDVDHRPIDITRLEQGTDIIAHVTVAALDNTLNYKDMALTTVMPSGWQISNSRLSNAEMPKGIEYQDIRDDRVLSYFSLNQSGRYGRQSIGSSVSFTININATFKGRFYLPAWQVEAMYDDNIKASTKGSWIDVVAQTPAATN